VDDPEHVLPTHERRRLLAVVTGEPFHKVYDGMDLTDRQAKRYLQLGLRRMAGEPLQYLEGTVQFGPIELTIDRRALIPRPETEQLVEIAVDHIRSIPNSHSALRITDIGTGSGCIAVALACNCPAAHVVATDVSADALAIARKNAARHNVGARIAFREGEYFSPVAQESFDLVLSNPPYVAEDAPGVDPSVRDFEPAAALFAAEGGLQALRRLAEGLDGALAPDGLALIEIGADQGTAAGELFQRAAHFHVDVQSDLAGLPRMVRASRQPLCATPVPQAPTQDYAYEPIPEQHALAGMDDKEPWQIPAADVQPDLAPSAQGTYDEATPPDPAQQQALDAMLDAYGAGGDEEPDHV